MTSTAAILWPCTPNGDPEDGDRDHHQPCRGVYHHCQPLTIQPGLLLGSLQTYGVWQGPLHARLPLTMTISPNQAPDAGLCRYAGDVPTQLVFTSNDAYIARCDIPHNVGNLGGNARCDCLAAIGSERFPVC